MDFAKARFNMVEQQIRPWDVLDFDVLDALSETPREAFVDEAQRPYAYADAALPLPNGSVMLEPRIVARLIQGLGLKKTHKVLEIGTGSGYATALLASLADSVVSLDIDSTQQARAEAAVRSVGYENVAYQVGDGLTLQNGGAPFDAIYVGGAVVAVPEVLKTQLKEGGRLVVVVGSAPVQRALLITRKGDTFTETTLFDTFIPYLSTDAAPASTAFRF